MKKTLTKAALKKEIIKLINETSTKVLKLVHENNCEIVLHSPTKNIEIDEDDIHDYPSGKVFIKEIADEVFMHDCPYDFACLVDKLEAFGQLELMNAADIEKTAKAFDAKKAEYDKLKTKDNAHKIEVLREEIARAEREIERLKTA